MSSRSLFSSHLQPSHLVSSSFHLVRSSWAALIRFTHLSFNTRSATFTLLYHSFYDNSLLFGKMKSILLAITFAVMATAVPVAKRAVFSTSTYDDLSISGGVAGNAEQEALQKLGGLPSDLSTVDPADLDFLDSVNGIANDAEVDAFNVAIDAAEGEEAEALEVKRPLDLELE